MFSSYVVFNGEKYYTNNNFLNLSRKRIKNIRDIKFLDEQISLKILNLNYNNIKEIPKLNNLVVLEILKLSNNKIREIKGLEKLSSLKLLDLSNNNIEKIQGLENLTSLRTLILSNNQIRIIENLEKLPKLEILHLNNNAITSIQGINHMKQLRYLDLSNNNITILRNLHGLEDLRFVSLYNNNFPDLIKNMLDDFKNRYVFARKVVKYCKNPHEFERLIFQEFLDECRNRDQDMLDEFETWKTFGGCQYIIGNLKGSLESLKKALEIQPDDEMLRFYYEFVKEEIKMIG
ncbi:MAG: leucine-rich repeat domain-containing protein [Candidatus Hodarchaeota archaeon]